MAKYRKKPVVIEAVQWNGVCYECDTLPDWLQEACDEGTVSDDEPSKTIKTLEGDMTANAGDWIIQGVKGEIYACKPDIFEATYEPA